MATEHERIAELRRRLALRAPQGEVRLSIGDDAAVLARPAGDEILSVDTQVEGVHFERHWLSLQEIGARAMAAALSDLAAMGATPRCALSAIICPCTLRDDELYALVDGIADAQARYDCPVVGGNLARGRELSVTTTVIGTVAGEPITRRGARPGDGVFVTGTLGVSALGLHLLRQGEAERCPAAVAHFRVPTARIIEGAQLVGRAHAAIDISDGLLQDLGHLCAASNVGCTLDADAIPRPSAEEIVEIAAAHHLDLLELALTGGEDYELLFAADALPPQVAATRIGSFEAEPGVRVLGSAGQVIARSTGGFDHFSG